MLMNSMSFPEHDNLLYVTIRNYLTRHYSKPLFIISMMVMICFSLMLFSCSYFKNNSSTESFTFQYFLISITYFNIFVYVKVKHIIFDFLTNHSLFIQTESSIISVILLLSTFQISHRYTMTGSEKID